MTTPRIRASRASRALQAPAGAVLVLAAVLVLGACGSGGAALPGASGIFGQGTPVPTAEPTPEPTEPEGTEEPTDEPTIEPTGEVTSPPTAPPTAAGSAATGVAGACGLDAPGEAGARLKDLDSYRTTIRIAGMTGFSAGTEPESEVSVEMVAVRVPELAMRLTISGLGGGETASAELTYIVIGDRAWMEIGGTAMEMQGDAADGLLDMIDGLSPETLYSTSISDWTGGLERVGEETKNGVTAIHCRASRETAAALGQALGGATTAEWSMDVWVARDGGYLVSAVQKGEIGTGSTTRSYLVQIDVNDVNSPANRVETPDTSGAIGN
jgi:hypothetical protein